MTLTVRTDALDDVASLRRLIGRVRKQAGGIDAVFHCAGVMDPPTSFLSRTPEEISRVLRPKTDGLRVLWAAFEATPPRLMVLFSSVAGAVPSLAAGHLDYAAANGVLDDFAAAHDTGASGCVVRALRWPLWRGVGMGLERTSASGGLGIPDLAADDALELLDLALRVPGDPVVLPCRVERTAVAADELFLAPRRAAEPRPAQPSAEAAAVPYATAPYGESATAASPDWLYAVVARTTKVDPGLLAADTLLGDIGVDSLLMAELVRALEEILRHPVDPSLLQEHPTLGGLAAALGAPPADLVPERAGPPAPRRRRSRPGPTYRPRHRS